MLHETIIATQLQFYKSGSAGCLFAAHAAQDPKKYGWRLSVCDLDKTHIEEIVQSAIQLEEVSTQSIIFPSVLTDIDLLYLLQMLQRVPSITLEQVAPFGDMVCLGYRVKVGLKTSWMHGFGSYSFLPKTRQAVFTEITFRSKPRPEYTWIMKESPPDVLHLADMDMRGLGENKFKSLWYGSLDNTERVLGHTPDLRSAAKTTFAVPATLWTDAI